MSGSVLLLLLWPLLLNASEVLVYPHEVMNLVGFHLDFENSPVNMKNWIEILKVELVSYVS